MDKAKIKLLSSLIIFSIPLLLIISISSAPLKVNIVNSVPLIIGFVIPSILISSVKNIIDKWWLLFLLILIGLITFDFLSAQVIVKREFLMGALILYPVGILSLGILLIIHGALCQYVINRIDTNI